MHPVITLHISVTAHWVLQLYRSAVVLYYATVESCSLYRLDRLTYSVQVTHYVAQLYACIYPVAFQLVCGYKLEIQLCYTYRCCIVHDQTGKF